MEWLDCPNCGEGIAVELPDDITKLHIEPGDILVYSYDELLSRQQAEQLLKQHHKALGPDTKAVIVAGGIKVAIDKT
jgi:hypothetical protein